MPQSMTQNISQAPPAVFQTAQQKKPLATPQGLRIPRTIRFFILPALLITALACPALAKSVELWSEPVSEGFGQVPPLKINLGKDASRLETAEPIQVNVAAYGSGNDIYIDLVLADPLVPLTQAELACTVMAAALTFHQITQSQNSTEKRAVRASLYPVYTGSSEYNVVLAYAVFQPDTNNPAKLDFPGPAWKQVMAVERGATELELAYLQQMQLHRYDWNIDREEQENMRKKLTPEQDAELSKKMDIKPGTINLAPLVLKPLTD